MNSGNDLTRTRAIEAVQCLRLDLDLVGEGWAIDDEGLSRAAAERVADAVLECCCERDDDASPDDICVLGLAVLAADRVVETMGFHLRTEKNRKKIRDAILYELRSAEVVIPKGAE